MITLNGPRRVEAGSTVCLTATNVGASFSATVESLDASVQITVKHNRKKHTATICYVAPAKNVLVTVHASDQSGSRGTSHTTLSI